MTLVPYGYCHCQCGQKTNLAPQTETRAGLVRGEPLKFIKGHSGRKTDPAYVEDDRGYETCCWIWQRYKDRDGYGTVKRDGRCLHAYRYYWEQQNGPVPRDRELDHLCRQRDCVRPDHLEPVTNAENQRRGANAKITEAIAGMIRSSHELQVILARRYGVDPSLVSRIRSGQRWRAEP